MKTVISWFDSNRHADLLFNIVSSRKARKAARDGGAQASGGREQARPDPCSRASGSSASHSRIGRRWLPDPFSIGHGRSACSWPAANWGQVQRSLKRAFPVQNDQFEMKLGDDG